VGEFGLALTPGLRDHGEVSASPNYQHSKFFLSSASGGNLFHNTGSRKLLSIACIVFLVGATSRAETANRKTTTPGSANKVSSATTKKKSVKRKKRARNRGQQKIDSSRTREIQEALIREHYLDGRVSGSWDSETQRALQRYQADNGWQSKIVPDSRALIKLGLGPDHEHLLNPQTAMTNLPERSNAQPAGQNSDQDHP
jgi:hypothetical protein